jgi:hypothetical protein
MEYHRLLVTGLLVLVGVAQGAEWFTSRGYHCINRCAVGEREGRQVYNCHTVDGVQKGGAVVKNVDLKNPLRRCRISKS